MGLSENILNDKNYYLLNHNVNQSISDNSNLENQR